MKRLDILREFSGSDLFSALDLHFGRFIQKLSGAQSDPIVPVSAMLASHALQQGDGCLDIASLAGEVLNIGGPAAAVIQLPDLASWRASLMASTVVGIPQQRYPLILDEKNRLYLYRYWNYEKRLSELIKARTLCKKAVGDANDLRKALQQNFPEQRKPERDWQKTAAAVAALKTFCVISGGPGTGKTFAVARILAVLLAQPSRRNMRVLLCAPTGKAAARLAESIAQAKEKLACEPHVRRAIPEEGKTIHRALKPMASALNFFYHAENRLPVDIVVVDEASMVDLPLMSKLIQALPDAARLILVGDRDQLASVEAGSVLGDICGQKQANGFSTGFAKQIQDVVDDSSDGFPEAEEYRSGIQDSIVFFTHPYRFDAHSGIQALSRAVNSGDVAGVMSILKENTFCDLQWMEAGDKNKVQELMVNQYGRLVSMAKPADMLACLDRFRIVCAVNRGPLGVTAFNHWVESVLKKAGMIAGESVAARPAEWYSGRPVMITRNDYELGLFNGDVGVAHQDSGDGSEYVVSFAESRTTVRQVPLHRLPSHAIAYAMTVHKSQGSEFDEMLLVLPDSDSPLLTRELLYTGITRARQKLSILAPESAIRAAVSRKIERTSGLRDALWA